MEKLIDTLTKEEIKNAFNIVNLVLNKRSQINDHFYSGDSDTLNEARQNVLNRLGVTHTLYDREVDTLIKMEYDSLVQMNKDYQAFYETFRREMALELNEQLQASNDNSDDLPF